jgi:hypothetical protein
MTYEGPSPEDLERFGGDAGGVCPKCGGEVSDLAELCPHCGVWMTGGPQHEHPEVTAFRKRMIALIAGATVIAFLGLYGLFRLF